jgi:superfamily II DNA helicase RecQ
VQGRLTLELRFRTLPASQAAVGPISPTKRSDPLLEALQQANEEISRQNGVRAFFTLTELKQIAEARPRTLTQLSAVAGVGMAKAAKAEHLLLPVCVPHPDLLTLRWCSSSY